MCSLNPNVHICKPSSSFQAQIDITFSMKSLQFQGQAWRPLSCFHHLCVGYLAQSEVVLRVASESCHLPLGPSRLSNTLLNEAITGRSDPSRQIAHTPSQSQWLCPPRPVAQSKGEQYTQPAHLIRQVAPELYLCQGPVRSLGSWRLAQMNEFSATDPHGYAKGARPCASTGDPKTNRTCPQRAPIW